jgi:ribonuclease R
MMQDTIRGRLSVHPRGFGFLDPEGDGESAFVPPPALRGFLADDVVSATVVAESDGRTSARDLQLVERTRAEVFGEVARQRGKLILRPDPRTANSDWPLRGAPAGVEVGASCVAEIDGEVARWSRAVEPADAGLESVRVRYGIPHAFPVECEEAAGAAKTPKLGRRRDLRDVPTVTIDGPSSKDLDDALSVLPPQADGAVRVLVSIADVDSVVAAGSPLDVEARRRGTSTYLPDAVTPMLPRALSENALSLLEGQDRAVLTVELRIDPQGRVTAVDLFEALLRSDARLTYGAVARFLDSGDGDAVPQAVHDTLRWLRTAAARLSAVRKGRGGVQTFSRTEVKLKFDAAGEPVALQERAENCAHRLIERLMVAANEAVAEWLVDRGLPGLFRVMEAPPPERVAAFSESARQFGFETGFGESITPRGVAAFEEQFQTATIAPSIRNVFRRPSARSATCTSPLRFGATRTWPCTGSSRRICGGSATRILPTPRCRRWGRSSMSSPTAPSAPRGSGCACWSRGSSRVGSASASRDTSSASSPSG